jgi:hypothetical protein
MKYKHEWCMQYERFYFVFVLCCEIVQWKLCNIALLFKEKKQNPEENIILVGPGQYTEILTSQYSKILTGCTNKDK